MSQAATFLDHTNLDKDFGGDGDESISGDAEGGNGNLRGPGGNAYSGNASSARGGSIFNYGDSVESTGGSSEQRFVAPFSPR